MGAWTIGCASSSSTPTTRGTAGVLLLCRRRPRVRQRRELRLDLRAVGLELRRQDHLRPELLQRHVDREAGAVVRDLEEHSARLAEVDRVEVVAVDDPRGRHARRGAGVPPLGVVPRPRSPPPPGPPAPAPAAAPPPARGARGGGPPPLA